MNVGKRTLEYRVGELYLCDDGISLTEYEILKVSKTAKTVLLKSRFGERWVTLVDFHSRVKDYLGTYKTEGKWFWKHRVLVNE